MSAMPERVQAYITPDGDVVLVRPNGDHRGVVLVPESRLLAAEARVREVGQNAEQFRASMYALEERVLTLRAERDALVQALADADVLVSHYEGYAVTAAIRANVTDLRVGVKPEILAAGERYRVRREGQARAILAREAGE